MVIHAITILNQTKSSAFQKSVSYIQFSCRLVPQNLSSTYFGVRNKCLQLLGCLGTVDKPLSKETDAGAGAQTSAVRDVLSVISDYFQDQDPRVRTAAIKAMVLHHWRINLC